VAAMVDFLLEHFSHAPWRLPGKASAMRARASAA